jgi:DNA-binding NtrC family response regulator
VMEHAVVLLDPGQEIGPDDLPHLEDAHSTANGFGAPVGAFSLADQLQTEYHIARDRILAEFEMQYLSSLIDRAGSNMSRAAKLAGVDRTTLYRLMDKHGLQRDTVIKVG